MEVMQQVDFDRFVEQYHRTVTEFAKGNPKPVVALLSHGEDTSLAGGLGGFVHGYDQVAKAIEFAATQFREGQVNFETLAKVVTEDMGYVVEIERYKTKLGEGQDVLLDVLRVTSIFRLEKGIWKLIHRHGDPTTAMNALVQLLPKAVVSIKKAV